MSLKTISGLPTIWWPSLSAARGDIVNTPEVVEGIVVTLDAVEVRAVVEEVLASPPFTKREWLSALLRRMRHWLDNDAGDLYLDHPAVFWAAILGLSLVVAFLTWHLVATLRVAIGALRRATRPSSSTPRGPIDALERLAGARRALRSEDYRRVVELCWTAVVAQRSSVTAGVTPREQARLLKRELVGPEVQQRVDGLLSLHEQACYAGELPDAARARRALAEAESLVGL